MDRGVWWAIVCGVPKSSRTEQLSNHVLLVLHFIFTYLFGCAGSQLWQMQSFLFLLLRLRDS